MPAWRLPGETGLDVTGCDVWLHHPWALGVPMAHISAKALQVGVGLGETRAEGINKSTEAHHASALWSERRWDFVTRGLKQHTSHLWWGSAGQVAVALQKAKSVQWQADPHADVFFSSVQRQLRLISPQCHVQSYVQPCLFESVPEYCRTFSEWWRRTHVKAS
jgi:hypothetical protein